MVAGEPVTLLERLQAATGLLEEIVADRALLAEIPVEDQNRFLQAAGRVSRPASQARGSSLYYRRRSLVARRSPEGEE